MTKYFYKSIVLTLLLTMAACGGAHKAPIIDATTKDSGQNNVTPPAPPTGACQSDADCGQGETCDQGVCGVTPPAKQPEGGACPNGDECDTGLVCASGVCQKPADPVVKEPVGGACPKGDECDTGLVCTAGICSKPLAKTPKYLGIIDLNLDTAAPTIVSYYLQGNDGITVTFSEPMKFDDTMDHAVTATLKIIGSDKKENDLYVHPAGAVAWGDSKKTAYFKFPHSFLANPGSVSYTFTVQGGDKGPTDLAGNHLTKDFIWDHSFTNAELGFQTTPPPSTPTPTPQPTPPSETPTGWAIAKPNAKDFVWVFPIVGVNPSDGSHTQEFWDQPRDFGSSSCPSTIAYNSTGMTGLRLKSATHVQTTLTGDHVSENLAVACNDEKDWSSLFMKAPTWYYDYGALDYEAKTDAGYALAGFKVDRCKNTGVIIGLTPMEVKVSSAGVDMSSSKEVIKGKFIIDDNTSCNDRETIDYNCNLGTLGGNGIINSVSVYYLNPVAQKGQTNCNPNTGVCDTGSLPPLDNSKNQAVGISITCERICSKADLDAKLPGGGCDFK